MHGSMAGGRWRDGRPMLIKPCLSESVGPNFFKMQPIPLIGIVFSVCLDMTNIKIESDWLSDGPAQPLQVGGHFRSTLVTGVRIFRQGFVEHTSKLRCWRRRLLMEHRIKNRLNTGR